MEDRLKEVINNKFYFVLDEVGASDCESELGSENSNKEPNAVGQNVKPSDDSNQCIKISATDNLNDEEFKNKNFRLPLIINSPMRHKIPKINDEVEIVKEHSNSSGVSKSSGAEEADKEVTIIDMDIDSEGECNESFPHQPKPLLKITFRDHSVEKLWKAPLIKFFNQKFEDHAVITKDEEKLELEVYEKNPAKILKNDLIGFDLDTTPTHGNYSEVPRYRKNSEFVLSDKNSHESDSSKRIVLSKITCFNCLQAHSLKDCPEVKDFRVINRNRIKFQAGMRNSKVSRYHLDEAQRFGKIQPGVISKKLRNALNLHNDEVPNFIYRMRLLGYPPAWLEEAKVSHSGVAMYDSKGHLVLEEDEEEGEIIAEGSKDKFDITKIIEFPGFNVPLPQNFKEEGKFRGYPEMSENQSKANLIDLLKPKTVQAYVKKTLVTSKSDETEDPSAKRLSSPTIEEMEEKKRQLLMELDDEESGSASQHLSEDSSSGMGPETETSQNISQNSREPGTVRNSEFGTPILKSYSPFSKLPSREHFSVNISDVINFENLPNSTGKYETMRHVITKIRTSTSKTPNN